MHKTTHFGYRTVETQAKAGLVREVFDSVAGRYDLMNDLMSFGVHRLWKRFAIQLIGVRPGHTVLDLASGTGDLVTRLAGLVGPTGQVLMSDINAAMLQHGRDRLIDSGQTHPVHYVQIDAEQLPLPDDSVDRITIAFGLRNVTDKDRALAEMYRVLKPGGRSLILEFSKPTTKPLQTLYDTYSFNILPRLGDWVAQDGDSYRYLVESIRQHPDQASLQQRLEAAGFEQCDVHNLSGGIVAIHRGHKL
ncbi:MAG: bifunctional demethylmenaquinone methyltransferase/2-methoxy-6-polyprenyl-1,4-benzoquinol methylase UbiE [Pseudomonadota bacterium]